MAEIGRKIYYELATGNVIKDTKEHEGFVIETTQEQDFEIYTELSERNPNAVGCLKLAFGHLRQNFLVSNGVRVNLNTLELEFSYPDPNAPETPQVYEKPLTEQISELQAEVADLWYEVMTGGI